MELRRIGVFFVLVSLMICGSVSAEMAATQALPLTGSDCAALWDVSHGVVSESGPEEAYSPSGAYSPFVAMLAANGYPVMTTSSGFLVEDLSPYKILIVNIGSAFDNPYTPAEVNAIKTFVDNGGKLLIMAENSQVKPENLQPISQAFGTTTGVSLIEPMDLTVTNLAAHPAFTGVSSIRMLYAGGMIVAPPSGAIAWAPNGEPVMSVVGNDVVIIGDINIFAEYFAAADNQKLALNIWDNVFCAPEVPEVDPTPDTTPVAAPEFPGAFVPAAFIIGFICVVLLAAKIREH